MRADQVRQHVITAIEAGTPISKTRDDDTFRHTADLDKAKKDRLFRVAPSVPPALANDLVGSANRHLAHFELSVRYMGSGEAAEIRMLQDSDVILNSLKEIQYLAASTQLCLTNIIGLGFRQDTDGSMIAGWDLEITYDGRTP